MRLHFTYTLLLGGLLLLGLGPEDAQAQGPFNTPPLFEELPVGSPPPVRFGDAAWGDYDGDGDFDLFLTGSLRSFDKAQPLTQLYLNNGDTQVFVEDAMGNLVEITITEYVDAINPTLPPLEDVWQSAVAWGDYDNDGYLDFFITGARDPQGTESLEVYHNGRNDQFTKTVAVETAVGSFDGGIFGSAFWGDYDNDRDLDVFVLGEAPDQSLTIKTLRNSLLMLPANTLPTAPDGLQATLQGNAVLLAWNPASDAQTPSPGLTYNLRVGTTPGGLDIVSPMAIPATGHRLVPRRGNVEHNRQWTLKNLPPGTYYWSVQAIDNSFKGSPFATEGTFTIGA